MVPRSKSQSRLDAKTKMSAKSELFERIFMYDLDGAESQLSNDRDMIKLVHKLTKLSQF